MPDVISPGSEPEPGVGTRIGVYELVRRIGDGAMGVVFEGRHTVLSRRVAIKLLRAELAQNPDVVTRFLQEARAANLASHDNIVSVTDTGQTPGGTFYLVMEYLEGSPMADVLARRRLEIPEIVRIFHQVLAALGAAHAAGLVHRDLKPGNVFLVSRGEDPLFVKLLDFGVAKLRGVALTATGMVIGTPQYMAPEQILGRPVDARTDIFAAGVMLYEAVVGEPPFRGATLAEIAAQIVHETPVPARQRVPNLPPYLERMIDRALAKDPNARWPDVHAMRAELPRLTAGVFSVVPAPPPAPRRSRLVPAVVVAGVAALVAVATGVLAVTVGGQKSAPPAAPAPDPRAQAEATLRDALASPDAAEVGDAVAALALAGTARTAPLLYPTLAGPPELRRQAARILADLKLPEAAPRIRSAFDASGDRLRVELAADLAALGDREALPALRRALDEPGGRLTAALALAQAGDAAAARPVLDDLFANSPRGRSEWRGAAEGLLAANDATARAALAEEMAVPDAARAVAAAAVLARHGETAGRDFLRRVSADKDFARRGEAALALAATGDAAARAYIPVGLASADPEERRAALAVAARVGGADPAALARAEADPDRRTRLVAAAAVAGGSP